MQKCHRDGEEPHVWKNSNAQHVLLSLLVSGEIPCTELSKVPMQEILNLYCLPRHKFDGFLLAKFPAQLEAMQKRRLEHRGHAELEQAVFCYISNTSQSLPIIIERSHSGMHPMHQNGSQG